MSYTPVYSSRINWENEPSIASPINATNLNKMDYALKAHDDTLANWDITKANESDLLLSLKSVDYDTDTGEFVFTWWNGTTKTVDLNIEKIPVSFSMDANGVITMTTDDGTTYTADVGALIKTYTFTDSSEIDFTVTTDASGNKTITASIVAGSIDGTKLTPNYLADCTAAKTGAETAEGKAEDSAEDAESWAVGTRGGSPVPSTDPAYENSAKWWAQHTSASFAGLSDTDISSPQNGQVPVYNSTTSKWENANPQAGGGSTITVTTSESALYGQNVTITDGVTTLTETFSNIGEATFTGVTLTGTLTLASGGASRSISIPYFGNYSFILSLFTATVTVTYPAGASCTLSDGVTTLTGTGSPMAFSVPNAGTWTATVTLDGASKTDSAVITTDGQTASITIEYGTINVTYDNAFRGTSITCVQSGTTITKTAPSGGNSMTFYPPTTGNWVISGTVSGTSYSKTANVTSLSTSVSVSLETVPDGKTTTPTDDIEKWLQCGQITGKSYTTLSQVLADAETYERLLSDSNACDYMARSTTWASTICADADAMMRLGKYDYACDALLADSTWATAICNSTYFEYVLDVSVPTMTSDTTPSGEALSSTLEQSSAYYAFNTSTSGALTSRNATGLSYVGYKFPSAVKPSIVKITLVPQGGTSLTSLTFNIEKSADNSAWEPVSTYVAEDVNSSSVLNYVIPIDTVDSNMYYRVSSDTKWFNAGTINKGLRLQFYGRHTAQTDIIVTAHGGDTVYYMENGSPVTLTTADSDTGIGTVDWSDLPKGAITLYSSTAKNPSDLTADYSKTVYITEYTTQIYLMPDNALYWWGHMSNDCEVMSTANGWSTSNDTLVAPTLNYTSVSFAPASAQASYIASKHALDTSKLYIIGVYTTGNVYAREYATKTFNVTANALGGLDSSSLICKEFTSTPNNYMCAGTERNRAGTINAFWHE